MNHVSVPCELMELQLLLQLLLMAFSLASLLLNKIDLQLKRICCSV